MALQGSSGKFLSANPEGQVACDGDQVGDWEVFHWISDTNNTNHETNHTNQETNLQPSNSSAPSPTSMLSSSSSTNQELNNRFRSRTLGLRHHSEPKSIIFK